MKTKFYLNGKKTTKKAAIETVGDGRLEEMIKESKEIFMEDPYVQNSYMVGAGGKTLTIEFC